MENVWVLNSKGKLKDSDLLCLNSCDNRMFILYDSNRLKKKRKFGQQKLAYRYKALFIKHRLDFFFFVQTPSGINA